MSAESTQPAPRSRRALLAGAIGGLGVWAASAIGRAAPAEAAAGDPIRMGRLNKASSTATTLQTKTSAAAYLVNQLGAGAAVKGVATSGRAIMAETGSGGTAVHATSPDHYGVRASCDSGIAVSGSSDSGVGVYAQSGTSNAVQAFSTTGTGVEAQTFTGIAILANAPEGVGVHGMAGPNRYGGRFDRQHILHYQDIDQTAIPAAPPDNIARIFVRDNGGKTQLCVRFPTGALQVIATEP